MAKNNNSLMTTTASEMYTSFTAEGVEAKMALYNAINSPDHRLADFINTPIVMKDAVLARVKLKDNRAKVPDNWDDEDDASDENVREGVRSIIIDMDGTSYTATSEGVYNSLKTLFNVFGSLHFEDGLKILVKQTKTKNGNTLTLQLAK